MADLWGTTKRVIYFAMIIGVLVLGIRFAILLFLTNPSDYLTPAYVLTTTYLLGRFMRWEYDF